MSDQIKQWIAKGYALEVTEVIIENDKAEDLDQETLLLDITSAALENMKDDIVPFVNPNLTEEQVSAVIDSAAKAQLRNTISEMVDAGLICITSFISPFESERQMVRSLMDEGEYVEVFVDTPLEICEQRDVKGLYAKARAGELPNFTGISSPYEASVNPEIRIDTTQVSAEEAADQIVDYLSRS